MTEDLEDKREKHRNENRRWRANNLEKVRALSRKWKSNNLEKSRGYTRKWRANNLEKDRKNSREYSRKWRAENPEKSRKRSRESARRRRKLNPGLEYGITRDEYDKMLVDQVGLCAACKEQLMVKVCIDHDHSCCKRGSCGKCIRGFLCDRCNKVLGLVKDDPLILQRAIKYLNKRKGK